MINNERCTYIKIGPEWFETCVDVPRVEVKGDVAGLIMCTLASSSFIYGCEYDWIKDACECRGPIISPIWRR